VKTLIDHLAQYGACHRDPRNIRTHLVGVPMIMLAVVILLSRPVLAGSPVPVTPALLAALAAVWFYARLDLRFGLVMALVLAGMLALGQWASTLPTGAWLGGGAGLFVLGWIIQFVGHWYEGRKPAFVDDVVGLLVGPLFVAVEIGFVLGCRLEVQQAVEARIGGVRLRTADATAVTH
jgi:uncharacterized membrane protein YGL010W